MGWVRAFDGFAFPGEERLDAKENDGTETFLSPCFEYTRIFTDIDRIRQDPTRSGLNAFSIRQYKL